MATFIVERYLPGVEVDAFAEAAGRVAGAAAALTEGGLLVRYLGSVLVPDEEYCVCRFEACDLQAVREANRRAGLPFWRVVDAVLIEHPPFGARVSGTR
jgi:uncharacterized protein DUF4242